MWVCLFIDNDGKEYTTVEQWSSAEEANMWGQRVLEHPEAFQFYDQQQIIEANDLQLDEEFFVKQLFD